MADISKRLEKADKYVQKGKLDAALDEYLAAWKEDPNNDHLVEVIAELYTRQNQLKNALECYGFLFDKYAERSEGQRASTVFRKMAKLGAPEPARMLAFAQFQERQKPDEALEYYRSAAQSFLDRGDPGRAVDALRGVATLKHDDAEAQTWLGEVAERAGRKDVATQAFVRAGELLRAAGGEEKERAMELLERAHKLSPTDGAAAQMLAQALMESGNPARAAELLEPFAAEKSPERTRLLAEAHLASGNCARAEELLWEIAPNLPASYQVLQRVAEGFLRRRNADSAVNLLRRLKKIMFAARKDREFVEHLQSLERKRLAGQEVLEFLASVYNELNYDSLFHGTQTRLFDLYMEAGQYDRAANSLDHLVDVDPYDAENSARLQQLSGKVDDRRYQALAGRFRHTSSTSAAEAVATRDADEQAAPAAGGEGDGGSSEDDNASLEDLVLQAEIFLQYGLKQRAVERLQKIAKRFPGEEARNDRLRALYASAQFSPKGAAAAAAAAPVRADGGSVTATEAAEESQADVARVTEISRNIYRQGTVKGVLSTSVNEIGKTWRASRCIAGLCTPGKPPSAAMEFCASTMKPSDVMSIVKLVTTLVQLTSDGNHLSVEDTASSQKLAKLQPVLQSLDVKSLLVLPMMDGEQPIGVVVLEQCDRQRRWRSNEILVLKSIVEQMVIATANVKLRSLMKTLAVADERSGILNRNSYIDCLVSECGRGQSQNTPLTIMLLKFGYNSQKMRELGDEVTGQFMEEATQALVGHLRQNDIGIRYDKMTVALVLPDTKGKDGYFVIEKLRKITGGVLAPDGQTLPMTAGIAEAVLQNTDPIDSVTDLINRLEFALEAAEREGPGTAKLL